MSTNDWILLSMALIGTFIHWAQIRATGQIKGNPFDYLAHNPTTTLGMIVAALTACTGLVAAETTAQMSALAVGYLGFVTGYAADAGFNKGPLP